MMHQEKAERYITDPKCKEKEMAEEASAIATGDSHHAMGRIGRSQNNDPELGRDELDKKREAKEVELAGESKKSNGVERNGGDMLQKENEKKVVEDLDSFCILSVVQERLSLHSQSGKATAPSNTAMRGSQSSQHTQQSQPGAYSGAPGTGISRVDNLRFSLVDGGHRLSSELTISSERDSAATQQVTGTKTTGSSLTESSPYCNNTEVLMEATPVEDEDFRRSSIMEALPMDQDKLDQDAARNAEHNKRKLAVCGLVSLAVIVLMVSLAISLTSKQESVIVLDSDDEMPASNNTSPIARPLPPLENLELLYHGLPDKTKESLYNNNNESPQYQAWDWLLHHPNITTYSEWRKKQIFAMATFYYSFEGPQWPEATPGHDRWMDVTTSECSWVMDDEEIEYWASMSKAVAGTGATANKDYLPCNEDGELQTLLLHQLSLPTAAAQPGFPPEIELLTSLKKLQILFGRIDSKLSDLLIPEVINLPRLETFNLQGSGIRGTIPKELGLMTGLKRLMIGANRLTGTIPTEVAGMKNLEFLSVSQLDGLTGGLPSELGMMSRLTALLTYKSPLTGQIPTELGRNDKMVQLRLWNSAFTGSVPSQLGLMQHMVDFRLGNDLSVEGSYNNFSGYIPTELWELSNAETFSLPNLPNLVGRIPPIIMMPNLTTLDLSGCPHLSGAIAKEACSSVEELVFDCSDMLCGCDDCSCAAADSINGTDV